MKEQKQFLKDDELFLKGAEWFLIEFVKEFANEPK